MRSKPLLVLRQTSMNIGFLSTIFLVTAHKISERITAIMRCNA
jgi:hypothetical protein